MVIAKYRQYNNNENDWRVKQADDGKTSFSLANLPGSSWGVTQNHKMARKRVSIIESTIEWETYLTCKSDEAKTSGAFGRSIYHYYGIDYFSKLFKKSEEGQF